MHKAIYSHIMSIEGVPIRLARIPAEGHIRGVVQIVHGFGEAIEHYLEMADFFSRHGFACVIHDQRGFGEMSFIPQERRKKAQGVISDYRYFLLDIKLIRRNINTWYPNVPVFLIGHSMGGNIALNYLLRCPKSQYKKAVIESPWLHLYSPLPEIAMKIARLVGNVSHVPAIQTKLNREHISRDPESVKGFDDGIYHNRMSLRLFSQVSGAGVYALNHAANLTFPTLLLCAGKDKVVSPKAIEEFAALAKDNVELVLYPEGFHALHMDVIGTEVLLKMLDFITS